MEARRFGKGDKIPVRLPGWTEGRLYEVVDVYPGGDYLTIELRVVGKEGEGAGSGD